MLALLVPLQLFEDSSFCFEFPEAYPLVIEQVVLVQLERLWQLEPQPSYRSGILTDLVRVESVHQPLLGQTLDLPVDKPSLVPLFVGTYHLAQYHSLAGKDAARRKNIQSFTIAPGRTHSLPVITYLSERRYALYKQQLK